MKIIILNEGDPIAQTVPEGGSALERVENALMLRATGYYYDETADDGKGGEKITRKYEKPDITAMKLLLGVLDPVKWGEAMAENESGETGVVILPSAPEGV